jgi:hypothetical protein
VRRANAYFNAGAGSAFVVGARDGEFIARLARAIHGPLKSYRVSSLLYTMVRAMARPLQLEFAGAPCHLTARPIRKKAFSWMITNLFLREVAERARVSPARISQIQAQIGRGKASAKMAQVLRRYKLKN